MAWSLSKAQRDDTVQRVAANLSSIAFMKGIPITDETVFDAAGAFERKAFTAATVASNTTTGSRPASESTQAYARKLADLMIEMIKSGGKYEPDAAAAISGAGAEAVDLMGSRDFLTRESTEVALRTMLAPGSQVSKIRFSSKSFGRDAADVAAKAIKNVSQSLAVADISDIIAGRPEDEVLDVLRIVSAALAQAAHLKELNLSDNALGEKGIRACAEVLAKQTRLEALAVQNVGCSIFACKALAELLTSSQHLRLLHLFNNMSDNEGAMHIASILQRSPAMQDFRMASSRVGPQGGTALAQALSGAGRSLVRLDISDNPMTEEVAPALAALIRSQPQIKALNLNDTSLTDKGVIAISVAIAESAPQLEELELALNEITPQGARAVALAVSKKPHLWKLNLRENEVEDKGAVFVSKGIAQAPKLRTIDLCANQIKRVGAVAVAKAAVGLPGLELLALDENMMSDAGLDELRQVFASAGKAAALGPLDENMEEEDEELEEDEEEGGDDAGLSALFSKAGI